MYADWFIELFVQEADGDLKSRFLLNILQDDITLSLLSNFGDFLGIIRMTVVISNIFEGGGEVSCLSLIPFTWKLRPGFCICNKLRDVKQQHQYPWSPQMYEYIFLGLHGTSLFFRKPNWEKWLNKKRGYSCWYSSKCHFVVSWLLANHYWITVSY